MLFNNILLINLCNNILFHFNMKKFNNFNKIYNQLKFVLKKNIIMQ